MRKPTYKIPHYRLRLVRDRFVRYPVDSVGDSELAATIMRSLLGDAERERMVVLYVNGLNVPVGTETVAVGGLHSVGTSGREIFKGALVASAAGIILGHNHPSGNPTPSPDDIRFTQDMVAAGALLGVPVIDHIIVSPNGRHVSFLSLGLIVHGSRAGAS